MPDRRRTDFRRPLPERAFMTLRERQSPSQDSSSSSSGSSGDAGPDSAGSSNAPGTPDDNPFAAPPEGRPDQPWQPRHPSPRSEGGAQGNDGSDDDSSKTGPSDNRPVWGSQWSDQQPGRQNGGFGGRPGGTGKSGGQGGGKGGPDGAPGGLRWDPTDPVQRRARYSVLGGMWAFFFALFDFPEIALLLGALAVYWSVSALRAKPRGTSTTDAAGHSTGRATTAQITGGTDAGTPGATAGSAPRVGQGSRQQTTAAVSGLVTALLALAIVATAFTVQLVYRDYYTCVNDALTKTGALACNDQLPKPLEPLFGVKK